jgi:putative ABC transport system substrate-binding protein
MLGGAATSLLPFAARPQRAMPAIGFLGPSSAEASADRLRGCHRGLKESSFVEGGNVSIVYRWAENRNL